MTEDGGKSSEEGYPLEKILSVSADDFFKVSGGDPKKFSMIGVHCSGRFETKAFYRGIEPTPIIARELAKCLPENTEMVVGYQDNIAVMSNGREDNIYYTASATALVKA